MTPKQVKGKSESDYVYRVIGSLDATEKRQLKIFATQYDIKEGNVYAQLLDAINSALKKSNGAKKLTEKQVKAFIKNPSVLPYYTSAKSKLKTIINDFLAKQGSAKYSEEAKIINLLNLAKMLKAKGFIPEYEKTLDKALQFAWQGEHLSLYQLALEEKTAYSHYNKLQQKKQLVSIYKESQTATALQQKLFEALYLYKLMANNYLANLSIPETSKEIERLKELLGEQDSLVIKYLALAGLMFYYQKQDSPLTTLSYAEQQLEILGKLLDKTSRLKNEYFFANYNYLAQINNPERFKELEKKIEQYEQQALKHLTVTDGMEYGFALCGAYILKLNLHLQTLNYDKLLKAAEAASKQYKQLEKHTPLSQKIFLQTLLKSSYFACNRYPDALKWVTELKKITPHDFYAPIALGCQYTELLLCHEQKAPLRIIRRLTQNLKESIRLKISEVEKCEMLLGVVKHIEMVMSSRNNEERKQAFNDLQKLCAKIKENKSAAKQVLSESDVIAWIYNNTGVRV
jgi:hypothetical protein